jgi:molybdenum cofactor cytidylyltransferase
MSQVGALILAAGASTRLGSPKQLVMLGGETLLERAARVATEAGCSPVVVVLGASAEVVRMTCELGTASVVVNKSWADGMGGSIAVGIEALQSRDVQGCVVMTCDMPSVTAAHLRLLIGEGDEVAASGYGGRRGVPAYFPCNMFHTLKKIHGEAGAKELLRSARCEVLVNGELDVDTSDDVKRVQEFFE